MNNAGNEPQVDLELAWAAGFFDGEGCASVLKARKDRYAYAAFDISQVEVEPLQRFAAAVATSRQPRLRKREDEGIGGDIWRLRFSGKEARRVLELLRPFCCGPKRQQIEMVLAEAR